MVRYTPTLTPHLQSLAENGKLLYISVPFRVVVVHPQPPLETQLVEDVSPLLQRFLSVSQPPPYHTMRPRKQKAQRNRDKVNRKSPPSNSANADKYVKVILNELKTHTNHDKKSVIFRIVIFDICHEP